MTPFSEQELAEFREYFGAAPGEMDGETFKAKLRQLRAKYHPDNFEKFGDDTVRQLATERFQRIERLAEKMEAWRSGKLPAGDASAQKSTDPVFDPRARFAYDQMKIEIRTGDKDLKYHLFGTFYRWLTMGDRFRIPESKAYLIADEEHAGRSIGYMESIRVYLTFTEEDPTETIAGWLAEKLAGRADTLLIEGERIPIDYDSILLAIKKRSFKLLAGASQ
ncbi:MAG: hypothetical protein H6575_08195 [Lewinellaceae bacterium]|nr:hypothetical protein [Saprospiraceae bacterium]MCB9354535.1 hypothetical protein [Lewinellaceae bacterium]